LLFQPFRFHQSSQPKISGPIAFGTIIIFEIIIVLNTILIKFCFTLDSFKLYCYIQWSNYVWRSAGSLPADKISALRFPAKTEALPSLPLFACAGRIIDIGLCPTGSCPGGEIQNRWLRRDFVFAL